MVNKTGYKGIELRSSGRYQASAYKNGKKYTVGTFDTVSEANSARDKFLNNL